MKAIVALLLFAFALPAQAVICKTVDADGTVAYSDIPAADCPNKVDLPEPSRYTPRPSSATGTPAPGSVNDPAAPAPADGEFTGYRSMQIEQPAQGSTIRNNQGQVPVSIALSPALQPGHKLRLLLDGVQIQPSFASQSVTLTGVKRGSHSVSAHVVNEAGVVLRSATPVSFTLRQASLNDPARAPEPSTGDQPPAGGADLPGQPQASDFAPRFDPDNQGVNAPDYRPGYTPSAATPGRTNPAFTPKYSQ